ncbi:hypothetical protein J2736_004279 [Paenibacillus qinlingensis]|uniref:Uncharacterized protein n=1 Tax=Paenibacillus qinlingensis TaxID=1837343 RepID=A0ABU1P1W6_9BACL|nr:hypothetical protein [Paenibacillus qinlingensis]
MPCSVAGSASQALAMLPSALAIASGLLVMTVG